MKIKKNTILYGISALSSVLIFAFFALPAYTETIIGISVGTSGYENLSFVLEAMELASLMDKCAAIAGLVLLILAGLTLVGSVVLLLCDLGVIKNEVVEKITGSATRLCTSFLILVAIGQFVCNIVAAKGLDPTGVGGETSGVAKATTTPGWAMIIITTILAFVCCEIIVSLESKKAKQREAEQAKAKEETPKEEPKEETKEEPKETPKTRQTKPKGKEEK